jgi:hypothetical protein
MLCYLLDSQKDENMSSKQASPWFKICAGVILFFIGVALVVKTLFFSDSPSSPDFIFGIQFITAGIYLFDGKFRGIGETKNK